MKHLFCLLTALLLCIATVTHAQRKLSIDKVYETYLRNSGTIMERNQIKGYYFLYLTDKIDKETNEYILQILDENLNKVKEIKFQDSKQLYLLEAAYNGKSLAFLFKNGGNNTIEMKIYGLDGVEKFNYSRKYNVFTGYSIATYAASHSDEGANQNIFDLGDQGYASLLPFRDEEQLTYQVDY